jgi:hypothetical protein
MVLLQIHADRVGSVPFEGDAPRSIDVNSVDALPLAAQPMEVEAGHIHLLGRAYGVKCVKAPQNSLDHPFVQPGPIVLSQRAFSARLLNDRVGHSGLYNGALHVCQIVFYI